MILGKTEASQTLQLVRELAKPRKLLLVDDDPLYLRMFTLFAADFNCQIDLASSYAEAMCKIEEHIDEYEFVWLDMHLNHGKTGFEVYAAIKKRSRLKPVILSSAIVPEIELQAISKMGVATFVLKPEALTADFVEELFACLGISHMKHLRL